MMAIIIPMDYIHHCSYQQLSKEMYLHRTNVLLRTTYVAAVELSVGELSVDEMSVGELSGPNRA